MDMGVLILKKSGGDEEGNETCFPSMTIQMELFEIQIILDEIEKCKIFKLRTRNSNFE